MYLKLSSQTVLKRRKGEQGDNLLHRRRGCIVTIKSTNQEAQGSYVQDTFYGHEKGSKKSSVRKGKGMEKVNVVYLKAFPNRGCEFKFR